MKKHIETLSDWIESREVRGYYTFTKEDIEKQFPSAGKVYIKTALYRLAAKAKIVSPWRNFYVIMPVEYSLKGVIPPVFYMDQLMSYLGKRYYVALLNAASFYGASHQRVQTFSLMVEQPSMRNTSKSGTSILFFSNGLNRVCTVLNELAVTMNLDSLDDFFFKTSAIPVFQRLGYILEHVLERADLAETLYSKMKVAGLKFRKIPFKINKPTEGCEVDKKWKVIINQEIEIDE